MGWIKGTTVCLFISFLTIHWSDRAFAVPSSSVPSDFSYYSKSLPSLRSVFTSPVKTVPKSGDCSDSKRQQLLNQASSLLKKLSPSKPNNPLEISSLVVAPVNKGLEKILIKNLVDCLEALDKDNTQLIDRSKNRPIISKVTYDSINNQYQQICSLAGNYLAGKDAQNVLSALNDLYTTFNNIIAGQLLNVELPNLCTKILAVNTQLEAIVVPEKLQVAIDAFIKSLTSGLTGQSQVTILAICNCLNDLETSIVTVVHNDKSEKLQTLLTNLINAMINAVVSATDSCDVVEIVQTYVASINDAIAQDAKSRTGRIYGSVLNFEKKLSKVLIDAGSNANKKSSDPQITPSLGSTRKNSKAPGSQLDSLNDATSIITDGTMFVIDEHVEQSLDDDNNIIELVFTGTYKLVDPKTNVSWSGSYVVREATIDINPDGSITIVKTAIYDVNLPDIRSSSSSAQWVKRQGIFTVQDKVAVVIDEQGNSKRTEDGTYTMTDVITGSVKSGAFVVRNIITEVNPDSTINIIKAGVLSVNDPLTTSGNKKPFSGDGETYSLDREYIFDTPDENGNLGVGIYDIETLTPPSSESGDYVVQQITADKNADGSVNTKTSGVFFYNGSQKYFTRTGRTDSVTDKYGHITPIMSGVLTRTDPNTGEKMSRPYMIQNMDITNGPDGSQRITKFGKFVDNLLCAPGTDCTPGIELTTGQAGSSNLNHHRKPMQVSKNSFDALLQNFKSVKPTSPIIKPIRGQTHPSQKPAPTKGPRPGSTSSNDGLTSVNDPTAKYKATSIATDNTTFIISEIITPLSNSQRNVIRLIEMGTYWFRDEITKISWSGAFETTCLTQQSDSQRKMNTIKAGKFDVAPPPHGNGIRVTSPVSGLFSINDIVVNGSSKVLTMMENGIYSLTDIRSGEIKSANFVVTNKITKQRDNGVIEVVKAGFLKTRNPDTTSPSQDFSLKGTGRYFLLNDISSKNPKIDGNNGTGVWSTTDSTTNEYVSGIYIIKERTITKNPDGSIIMKTNGLSYTSSSNYDPIAQSPNYILNSANTRSFESIDNLVTVKDVNGRTSMFGTGKSSQKNIKTGEIYSVTYELKNFVMTPNEDGTTNIMVFGRIPYEAHQVETQSLSTSPPIVLSNDVRCTFSSHIFGTPRSDGNYGTGTYEIQDFLSEEFVTGTYTIQKRAITTNSNGTVNWKTSGVLHVDVSRSSPTRFDIRLAIVDGSEFTLDETVSHGKDVNGNIVLTGTGLFTRTIRSTGSTVSTSYTIESLETECSFDGAQDIIRSGPMDYTPVMKAIDSLANPPASSSNSDLMAMTANLKRANKAPRPSTSDDGTVYFSITHLLRDLPDDDGNYGTGVYRFEKPTSVEFVTGSFVVQERTSSINDDGTMNWETSGIILIQNSQLSPSNSDTRLAVVHGAKYTLKETVAYIVDVYNNIIVAGTGLLTQTDPKSGIITSIHYTIDNFDVHCNSADYKNVTRSGIIDYTETTAGRTDPANSLKSPANPSNVPVSQTPNTKPVITVPSTPANTKDDVSFEFVDHLYGIPQSDGNYGTGEYKINDLTTKKYVAGTYVIQKRSIEAQSNGVLNRNISGIIHVDGSRSSPTSSDTSPAVVDGAKYTLEETIYYSKDSNNNVILSATGVFTQIVPSSGFILTSKYTIEKFNAKCNSDGSEAVSRSGMIYDRTSSSNFGSTSTTSNFKRVNKAPKTSTSHDGTVYVSMTDIIRDRRDQNGNHGTVAFRIEKPTTNEFVEGTSIIRERSTSVNDDGTVNWKTSGVISIVNSQLGSTSYDTRLSIVDGAQYTIEETVSYSKGANDNVIVTGNGLLTQTDWTNGVIISTYYTINAFDANCNIGGYKNITRSGTVDSTTSLAYLPSSKPNAVPAALSGTGVAPNYVGLPRSEVISALGGNNLEPGNAVLIQATNGNALLAKIRGLEDPIRFDPTTLADVIDVFTDTPSVWTIPEEDLSPQYRRLIDIVTKEPCQS